MRIYQFNAGEVVNTSSRVTIVDLDSIVMLQEILVEPYQKPAYTLWRVTLSAGHDCNIEVTKSAFDRILLAWKSK